MKRRDTTKNLPQDELVLNQVQFAVQLERIEFICGLVDTFDNLIPFECLGSQLEYFQILE